MNRAAKWTMFDKAGGLVMIGIMVVGSTIGAIYGWRALWPASHWYRLNAVQVDDAEFGNPIKVTPDRHILRDFNGSYVTTVREVLSNRVICSGGERVPYRAGAGLRPDIDIEWWTAGAEPSCMKGMIPGKYVMTTCIFVQTEIPLVGERGECVDSNIFEVFAHDRLPLSTLIKPDRKGDTE